MAIIDTSTVIDLGRGKERAVEAIRRAESEGETLKISSISVFELAAGSPAGIEEKRRKLLEPFRILNFSPAHAEKGAIIYRQLRERGEDIGPFDSMIAGTALMEKETLITGNSKHFGRIEGIRMITY